MPELLQIVPPLNALDVVYLGNCSSTGVIVKMKRKHISQQLASLACTDVYCISYRAAYHLTEYILSVNSSLSLDSLMSRLCNATQINAVSLSSVTL